MACLKPSPRSRAADVPAIPSSWITLAPSPNFCAMKSPAIFPPAILSDAIWLTTFPLAAPRSNVITGI